VLVAGSGGGGGAGCTALSDGTRNKLGSAVWDKRCDKPGVLSNTFPDDADRRGVQLV